MIVSIHQPNYLPWIGYFYKISQSDIFVLLDDVQYSNQGMHNYHYLKTPQGRFRMKIPVNYKTGDLIYQVGMREELNWRNNHLKAIELNYKKTPFFREVMPDLNDLLLSQETDLSKFNEKILRFFCEKFNINTKFVRSSELNIQETKEKRIIEICKAVNADVYYSGTGARAYQNEGNFAESGIELRYSNYTVFEYEQLWGGFESNVAIIDYCMNCGYDWDRIINSQRND